MLLRDGLFDRALGLAPNTLLKHHRMKRDVVDLEGCPEIHHARGPHHTPDEAVHIGLRMPGEIADPSVNRALHERFPKRHSAIGPVLVIVMVIQRPVEPRSALLAPLYRKLSGKRCPPSGRIPDRHPLRLGTIHAAGIRARGISGDVYAPDSDVCEFGPATG